MIHVTINGENRQFDAPIPLNHLLSALGIDPRKVALERNLEIVPRSTYEATWLADGDLLEVVHFIGGGDAPAEAETDDDYFEVAGRRFHSRLLVGTGKYKDFAETRAAIEMSGAEIVTVAIRRTNIGQNPNEPSLLEAVVWQESRWNPRAVSPVGAKGLAQLMPGTARDMGVNPDDPLANLEGGARYLRLMLNMFGGDLEKALAAYNAGPARVAKANGIPRIRETQNYVSAIMGRLSIPVRR